MTSPALRPPFRAQPLCASSCCGRTQPRGPGGGIRGSVSSTTLIALRSFIRVCESAEYRCPSSFAQLIRRAVDTVTAKNRTRDLRHFSSSHACGLVLDPDSWRATGRRQQTASRDWPRRAGAGGTARRRRTTRSRRPAKERGAKSVCIGTRQDFSLGCSTNHKTRSTFAHT